MGQYYKVVYRTRRGDLMSVWIKAKIVPDWLRFGKKRVSRLLLKTYSTDKWTEASPSMLKPGYGLCVFSSHKCATDFRDEHFWMARNCIEVWEAEVEDTFDPPDRQLNLSPGAWGTFTTSGGLSFPMGTMMCKRAKLIEKVS